MRRLTGQVAGGTLGLARNTAAMTAMFGENWLRFHRAQPVGTERLEAMAEAGIPADAEKPRACRSRTWPRAWAWRTSPCWRISSGQTIMPLEVMLRSASLLARRPHPFQIKFMRTYNPALEKPWSSGVCWPAQQYERERRFLNLYRQHDVPRVQRSGVRALYSLHAKLDRPGAGRHAVGKIRQER